MKELYIENNILKFGGEIILQEMKNPLYFYIWQINYSNTIC